MAATNTRAPARLEELRPGAKVWLGGDFAGRVEGLAVVGEDEKGLFVRCEHYVDGRLEGGHLVGVYHPGPADSETIEDAENALHFEDAVAVSKESDRGFWPLLGVGAFVVFAVIVGLAYGMG